MRNDRLTLELETRLDKRGGKFYVAKLKCRGLTLDFSDGITFLVFTSEDGNEELQITGFEKSSDKNGEE